MKIRLLSVVACCGMLCGGAFAAGGTPGGFSDSGAFQKSKRVSKWALRDSPAGAATDETSASQSTQLLTPLCDFVGFQQGELVNGAYAGGSGSLGTVRSNFGVAFSGATALNTWNGTGSPSAGTVSNATTGIITISDATGGSGWRQIDLYASNSVTLTVQTFSATNASGTALETFTIPANVVSGPYSTWTARQFAFSQLAKSVRVSGTADRWGLDNIALTSGCPAPTSSSDDCNGNGMSDACEIASGMVQDCNANGTPDSCDIAGTTAQLTSLSFEEYRGAYKTVISDQYPGLIFERGANGSRWTANDVTTTGSGRWNASGWDAETNRPSGLITGSGEYWVEGQVWCYPQDPYGGAGTIRLTGNGASFFECKYCSGSTLSLEAYDSDGVQIALDSKPANRRYQEGNSTGPGTLRVQAPSGKRIAKVIIHDSGNLWEIDSIRTDVGRATPVPDCNSNGIPDSCEIADGTAVDQNGNGIPDACDPTPSLTLTANAAACNAVGSTVQVDARLSGVLNLVVAGQLVIDWDPGKLQLLSAGAGDAPYDNLYTVNQSAGQAVIVVSSALGGTGTSAASVIVSRLQFQVLGGSCDGSGTAVTFGTYAGLSTVFTDGFGGSLNPSLIGSTGFVVDDGAPVISNVPADQSVQAEAGENGFAHVTLGTPTVTDGCATGLTATGTRSDGRAMSAAWPSGTTTVTWSATDPCGNVSLAYTSVTVDPTNTMDFEVSWSGTGFSGSMSRTLSLTMFGGLGTQTRTASANASNGNAAFSVSDLPVDNYTCATIEDSARTLRRRVSVSDAGAHWSATAALVSGDIINDEVIDVLDWGAYVVRNPNADLNGDGVINATDGNLILANFGLRGDSVCGGSLVGPRAPLAEVSVDDLVAMGLPDLAGADLNGDGWVDSRDMDMFHN